MDKAHIRDVSLTISSNIDLKEPGYLEEVLALIELPSIKPELMFFNELELSPYSGEKIRGELREKLKFGLGVKRRKTMKYTGMIHPGYEPVMNFVFHNSISKKNIQKLFAWSDELANAFPPEAGTLTIVPKLLKEPVVDMRFKQAFHGGFLLGGDHSRYGPKLGMYTWLCKRHVDAIGLNNLKATPMLTVEEQKWGGVKLILGETQQPWEMDRETWVESWHAAMDHLRQFHVFAYPVVDGEKINVYRGKNCETPRPDGKVRDVTSYLAPEDRPS